jgi:hypothetical protein
MVVLEVEPSKNFTKLDKSPRTLRHVVWKKLVDVSEGLSASIVRAKSHSTLMTERVSTF